MGFAFRVALFSALVAGLCGCGGGSAQPGDAQPDGRAGDVGEWDAGASDLAKPDALMPDGGIATDVPSADAPLDALLADAPLDALLADAPPGDAAPDAPPRDHAVGEAGGDVPLRGETGGDAVAAADGAAPRDVSPETSADAARDAVGEGLPDTGAPSDTAGEATADLAHDVDVPPPPPCPPPAELVEPSIGGRVYEDGDCSAQSLRAQRFVAPADSGLGGELVQLLGAHPAAERATCPDGTFAFGALPAGSYLLALPRPGPCTSNNRPVRLPDAIRSGAVTLVTFGDSIPAYGAEPFFPARLAALLRPLAPVSDVNLAVPGTMTTDWLPGTALFENTLAPELAAADVAIISLGGNDIQNFANCWSGCDPAELAARMEEFPAFFAEVLARIHIILDEVRARAPQADVVYLIYPNYGRSSFWAEYAGEWIGLVELVLDNTLRDMRRDLSRVPGVLLADLLAATAQEDLDRFLSDPLHLSDAGADFWAREVFQTLGGALVGPEPLGSERMFGFAPASGCPAP